jgi:hypothetical protein
MLKGKEEMYERQEGEGRERGNGEEKLEKTSKCSL